MDPLAIITGASRGIGASLVDVARRRGWDVATLSRSEIDAHHHLAVDLAEPASWPAVREWLGGLVEGRPEVRFFHCAATLAPIGFAGEVDPDAYATQVVVNSAAAQIVGDAFLRSLADDQRGLLVQISSGAATSAYAGWSAYCAAKAAVDQWTRVVGVELDHRGKPHRVVSIAPGVVATGMQEMIRDTSEHDFPRVGRFEELYESGSLAEASEVAARLWDAVGDESHDNGAVLDLRSLS